MGCANSTTVVPHQSGHSAADAQNLAVEEQMLRQKLEQLYTFKILLLGAGESGKSTIVKQFRLIHNKKPTKAELDTMGDSLHQNVIDCMRSLVGAARKFGYHIEDDDDRKVADSLDHHEENSRLNYSRGEALLKLFGNAAIKRAYARRAEYWLLDGCDYYMKHVLRFCEQDFEPTEEDTVMARIRTTGIVYTNLEQKVVNPKEDEPELIRFQVVDVGGQRNERKKWIHCFSDVKAVLFIVNLNGYNQVLFEDNTKNRMIESLELFRDITHNPTFANTPIVLFLNKKDLFETMIRGDDKDCPPMNEITDPDGNKLFADYTGGRDVHAAIEYIKMRFKKELPVAKQSETLDIQVVTGVVKRDIKTAFDDVKKQLYEHNRKNMDKEKAAIRKELKAVKASAATVTSSATAGSGGSAAAGGAAGHGGSCCACGKQSRTQSNCVLCQCCGRSRGCGCGCQGGCGCSCY